MGQAGIAGVIDWGGTKLLVGLVGVDGRVIDSTQVPTPTTSPVEVLDAAASQLQTLLAAHDVDAGRLAGIGVSAPGVVNATTGHLVFAPARGWRDVDIRGHLSTRFAGEICVANDVDNCMRAEQRFGATQDAQTSVWVTVSTGIGGCIVHNGQLFGGRGAAGEIGHIVVDELGPLCGCGNRGCLEAVASGPAIVRRAHERGLFVESAQALAVLAASGNAIAAELFVEASQAVGRGIAAVINVIDPDCIVFGGGVSESLDLSVIQQCAIERSIRVGPEPPRFLLTRLGLYASLVGAAALVFERRSVEPPL